uniref:RxLR effector candidate protein n=1 Tax=Hyaloperonospora arabidopsidis (strain Emoy2) TaxID=559515 RepID=A0A090BAY0_HYAAE|nr:RxLR effector candidate protein [Hyaloperonospora arabidopsidis Emoy2]
MRITSVYAAIVAASLHAIGSAVSTATNVGATVLENKTPAAIAPSLRTSEGRSLWTEEKRGQSDLEEERGRGNLPTTDSFSASLKRFIRALFCMGSKKGMTRTKSSGSSIVSGHGR